MIKEKKNKSTDLISNILSKLRPVEMKKKIGCGTGSLSKNIGQLGLLTKKIVQLKSFNLNMGGFFRRLFCIREGSWLKFLSETR